MASEEIAAVEPLDGGAAARLLVRAQPGARRSAVAGWWNGRLKVALRSPPLEGRANAELVELLARVLELRRSQVSVERGLRGRLKELRVELPAGELRRRLLGLVDAGG